MSGDIRALESRFLDSAEALEHFVAGWRMGTLPKTAWTHAAHVAVAAYYTFDLTEDAAFRVIKPGIIHFNICVGTANTEDSGYHETLTRFWTRTIGEFVSGANCASRFEAVRKAVEVFGEDRSYFKRYYSFDVIGNRRARQEWIEPDNEPFVASERDQSCVPGNTPCDSGHG